MSDNTVVMLTREGQRVNVPSAEVRSRYNSGQFGFPRDEPIAVYDRFVRRQRTVSPDEIGTVINDRVDVLPTLEAGAVRDNEAQSRAEAEQRRQVEQEYGDVGSMVGTAAENLVGGATFGLSHLATNALSNIPGLGALSQEDRMRRAQVNPATAVATDITGAIVPSVAAIIGSGGAATPAVGAGLAGAAARTGVRAAVGRAAGTAGRAVGRAAAQYTPAGAVTRGALAAGRGATSRIAGARVGAAAGMGLEGVIEGAAAGLGATIREAANNQGEVEATDLIMSAGENVAGGALFGGALGAAAGGVLSSPRVAEWLNDWSDSSWLRSTGAAIPAARSEAFDGQGAAAVGALSRRFNLIETGPAADNSLEAIRGRAVRLRGQAEQQMSTAASSPAMEAISVPVANARQLQKLVDEIDTLVTPAGGDVTRVAVRANNILRTVARPNAPIRAVWDARKYIDNVLYGRRGETGVYQLVDSGVAGADALKNRLVQARISMSRSIDDALTAGERRVFRATGARHVAGEVPVADRAKVHGLLQDSFEKYNAASAILEMTRRTDPTVFNKVWSVIPWGRLGRAGSVVSRVGQVARGASRAASTPGGKVATVTGAGIGALSGNAVLGGLLTGAIYPIMYRRGQLTGALLSEKVLQTIGLKRQAGVIQDRLRNKILGQKRTFTPKPRAVGAAMGKVSDQMRDYDNIAREVRQSAANPNPSIDRATQRVPQDLPVAAGAAAAMQAVHIDLAAKNLPRGVVVPSLISHQLNPDQLVSDQERSAFIRFVDGLKDPNSLTVAIMNGTVSYELVDAVREGHPVWFAVAKNAVLERLQDGENPLPHEERLALSSMFPEENIDPSVAPDMIRQFQEPFMARATGSVGGQMSGGGGSSPQPAPNIAQLEKTRVQQLMS